MFFPRLPPFTVGALGDVGLCFSDFLVVKSETIFVEIFAGLQQGRCRPHLKMMFALALPSVQGQDLVVCGLVLEALFLTGVKMP